MICRAPALKALVLVGGHLDAEGAQLVGQHIHIRADDDDDAGGRGMVSKVPACRVYLHALLFASNCQWLHPRSGAP